MKIVMRIAVALTFGLLLGSKLHAADFIELSKTYVGSRLTAGWADHYHEQEHGSLFNFSVAGMAFSEKLQMDPFFSFEHGLKEFGFLFPFKATDRIYILPAAFRNFEADAYGLAVTFTVKVR